MFKQPRPPTTFLTPQARLVKPVAAGFLSTGIISKKNRPRDSKPTPETPAKRLHFHAAPVGQTPMIVRKTPAKQPPESPIHTGSSIKKPLHYASSNQSTPSQPHKMFGRAAFDLPSSPPKFNIATPLRKLESDYSTPGSTSSRVWNTNTNPAFSVQGPPPPFKIGNEENSPEHAFSFMRPRRISSPDSKFKGLFSPPKPGENMSPIKPFTLRSVFKNTPIHSPSKGQLSLSKMPMSQTVQICTSHPQFLSSEYFQCMRNHKTLPSSCAPVVLPTAPGEVPPDYFETHFHTMDKLGHGEFANAYKVYSKEDGKLYAVKKARQPYSGHRDR